MLLISKLICKEYINFIVTEVMKLRKKQYMSPVEQGFLTTGQLTTSGP